MKAAIYARVSTERQEKLNTIESQISTLCDYAKANDYIIVEKYLDEGYSGELLARPSLDRLRDDAKNKHFDVVLVHSPDRLSRKFIHLGLLEEEFRKYELKVTYLNRPDSKDTPEDNLLAGIQGLIGEYEKSKILERTRRGKLHKAKNNCIVGSIAPYGYNYVKGNKAENKSGYYKINEEEAKTVRLIFELFNVKKLSIREIVRELTRRGISPRKGKQWRTSSLHKIIRNETYTGVTYYNKNLCVETDNHSSENHYRRRKNTGRVLRPREEWIAITLPDNTLILDKRTFGLAQKQLVRNAELSPRNTKYEYLLRGFVKCAKCGSPFHGTPSHGKLYYRCGNRDRTFPLPKECNALSVKAAELENAVWDKFCEVIQNPSLIESQIPKIKGKTNKSKIDTAKEIENIELNFKKLAGEESRILDAYRENIITIDQLKEQTQKIKEKKDKLEEKKSSLLSKEDSNISRPFMERSIKDFCKLISKKLAEIKDDFESKRQLLSLAINRVDVDGKHVKIRGIIPLSVDNLGFDGNIASPIS